MPKKLFCLRRKHLRNSIGRARREGSDYRLRYFHIEGSARPNGSIGRALRDAREAIRCYRSAINDMLGGADVPVWPTGQINHGRPLACRDQFHMRRRAEAAFSGQEPDVLQHGGPNHRPKAVHQPGRERNA